MGQLEIKPSIQNFRYWIFLLAAEYGVRLIVGMLWQLFKLCSAVESPDSDVHMLAKVVGTTAPGCYQNLWTLAICSRGTLDDTVNDGFRFSIASYPISEREVVVLLEIPRSIALNLLSQGWIHFFNVNAQHCSEERGKAVTCRHCTGKIELNDLAWFLCKRVILSCYVLAS